MARAPIAPARLTAYGPSLDGSGHAYRLTDLLPLTTNRQLSLATVDEETLIVHWKKTGDDWTPRTAMKLWWRDGKVTRVRDYIHILRDPSPHSG